MSLADDLMKAFGSAQATKAQKAKFFSTGYPPLDKIISGKYDGGVPSGQIVEIFGSSGVGKTHLLTEIMVSAQRQGGVAMLIDYERRFRPDFAERRGLNIDPPHFIHHMAETWESGNGAAIKFAEMVRKSGEYDDDVPIVIGVDSIAAAIPRSMLIDSSKSGDAALDRAKSLEYNMNDTTALARVTSTTLKVIAHFARELNATFIYLNQTRSKPGVAYGDPTTTPGGSACEFYADVRLSLSRSMEKEGSDVVGQVVTAKTVKCAITRPLQKVSWVLEFADDGDTRFNRVASLVEYMVDEGMIESPAKGWLSFNGEKLRKKQLIEMIKAQGAYDTLVNMLKVKQ